MPKLLSYNNASYTDCFFTFLTSKVLNENNFIHGLDFYGTFLGIQEKFKMNISDDLDYLNDSKFFVENIKKYYTVVNYKSEQFLNNGSRCNKMKLKIEDDNHLLHSASLVDLDISELPVEELQEIGTIDEVYTREKPVFTNLVDDDLILDSICDINDGDEKNNDDEDEDEDDEDDTDDDDDEDEDEDDTDDADEEDDADGDDDEDWSDINDEIGENVLVYIDNFPIQMICMERCDGTLDDLFEKELIDVDNGASYLMQIIMILIAYQKMFKFTHNDLHTNNIMYVNTTIEYLYYSYKGKTYKVPTYGRIIKLIDFGRSIYTFQKKIFCSDSFDRCGDANGQYNFPPYYDTKKPLIHPNYSFDICRLGCSIFDFLFDIDNMIEPKKMNKLQKIIYEWCLDDNGQNMLYKKNGEERYHNFKLYKMIARTANNHLPSKQLSKPFFSQFLCEKIDNVDIMDIDTLPIYA
jgi:hypothetical protein